MDLRLIDAAREYGGTVTVHALRGVSLDIRQGEFVTIVGPSGGGKSTLLNLIGLLDTPSSGSYLIDGQDTATLNPKALAELRSRAFAFIFQGFHLLDRRPVIDSVELGMMYRAVPSATRHELARDALRQVGLEELATQPASKLSGGQRQRVAIARAIASAAPVIVADEPTGNLDSANGRHIMRLLQDLNHAGATVILVTHDPELAAVGDRTVHIRDGLVERVTGAPAAVLPTQETPSDAEPLRAASRVRARDVVSDASRSVSSRIARSIGLIAAVATGVALAVATLGLSVSASSQVTSSFDRHANRDVTLAWTSGSHSGSAGSSVAPGSLANLLHRIDQVNGVSSAGIVGAAGTASVQSTHVRPAYDAEVYTTQGDTIAAARLGVAWTNHRASELGASDVLIGSGLANKLSLGPRHGGAVISVQNNEMNVVGIINSSPRMPVLRGAIVTSAHSILSGPSVSRTRLLIRTDEGAAQQIARRAPWVVDPAHAQSIAVDAPTDPSALRDQVENDVAITLLSFTGVALLAAIAALTNAMVLAVLERRAEIGLRRALGARPKHIVALVLFESIILGAAGGISGLFIGICAILAVTVSHHWAPVLDPSTLPLAVFGGVFVGALGGAIASIRAARIEPHEALRL